MRSHPQGAEAGPKIDTNDQVGDEPASSRRSRLNSSLSSPMMPSLRKWEDRPAPLPPSGGPVGLQAFFSGLAAGDDMSGLVQTLRRTMLLTRFFTTAKTQDRPAQLPSPVPSSSSSASLWEATRAAMLLSTEHPDAAVEATFLYFSPDTHTALAGEREQHGEEQRRQSGNSRRRGGGTFPLRQGRVRALLSDRAAIALARHYLKEKRDVAAALDVLAEVDSTPAVSALLIECYSKSGEWEQALASLAAIPTHLWTERDVALTIRSVYHAALAGNRGSSKEGGRMLVEPLHILRQARASGVTWSSPGAVNDALGLLSLDSRLWPEAVELLDALLMATVPQQPRPPPSPPPPQTPCEMGDEERSDLEGSCRGPDGLASIGDSGVRTYYPARVSAGQLQWERFDALAAASPSASPPPPLSRTMARFLRANAITVYQTCRALRARPDLAFQYASKLVEQHNISVTADFKATEAFLRACVKDGRWEAALSLMQLAPPPSEGHDKSGKEAAASAAARTYSADILVSLLKLLGERNATHHYEDVLARLLPQPPQGHGSSSSSSSSTSSLALSKHYSTDTLSRAYNTMIQHASTLTDAETFYTQLRSRTRWEQEGGKGRQASGEATGKVAPEEDDPRLENESYEKFTMLYAQAGDWQRALGCLNTLLHHPKRSVAYLPTTRIHDAVQYALEQSSPRAIPPSGAATTPVAGGAPWQLSVALFKEMCDRDVPTSTVAFQSVVKKCFAQGASGEAQKLFQLLMRRGVRP